MDLSGRVLDCSEFLGRNEFKSYSEFVFMMCCAKEVKRLGGIMDFSNMKIDKIVGDKHIAMFKWMIYRGDILVVGLKPTSEPNVSDEYVFNMDLISKYDGHFFDDRGGEWYWDYNWYVNQKCWGSDLVGVTAYSQLGTILLHITAHLFVGMKFGYIKEQPVRFCFTKFLVKSTNIYINLLSLNQTLDWFSSSVNFDIDFDDASVDIDLSLYINNCMQCGRFAKWGIKDKKKQLKELGVVVGGIFILYERKGVVKSNIVGRIVNASIVKILEIRPSEIIVQVIPVFRTKEEIENDYYSISENERFKFDDLLEFKISCTRRTISLYSLAIGWYIYDEELFLLPIDEYGEEEKYISVDGERGTISMSQRDAIYYLLCQFNIDFDKDLYKSYYPLESGYTWDNYDCSFHYIGEDFVHGTYI